MTTLTGNPTPQERLENSRRALVKHMRRDEQSEEISYDNDGTLSRINNPSSFGFVEKWRMFKHAALTWWHYHPAHVAIDLAKPLIGSYAEKQPFKLLAIAAGVGAASVVLKPWRLISLGSIALAALKSSEFSNLLLSLMSKRSANSL